MSRKKMFHHHRTMAAMNPVGQLSKSEKTGLYVTGGVLLVALGAGIWLYEKKAHAAGKISSGGTNAQGGQIIQVNALNATLGNVLNMPPVTAKVGDTLAVQLGQPINGSWVDQSTGGLQYTGMGTGASAYTMMYNVTMAGVARLGIAFKSTAPNTLAIGVVAFAVNVS